jgi:hypothetical protein
MDCHASLAMTFDPSSRGTNPCRVSARLCRWLGIDGLLAMTKPVFYRLEFKSGKFFKYSRVLMQINLVLS